MSSVAGFIFYIWSSYFYFLDSFIKERGLLELALALTLVLVLLDGITIVFLLSNSFRLVLVFIWSLIIDESTVLLFFLYLQVSPFLNTFSFTMISFSYSYSSTTDPSFYSYCLFPKILLTYSNYPVSLFIRFLYCTYNS